MSYAVAGHSHSLENALVDFLLLPLKFVYFGLRQPVLVFLIALTAMLFRPPDLKTFPFDRVFFLVLIMVLCVRGALHCERLRTYPITWPFLGLLCLGLWGAITQPYDSQVWSLFAAKWAVPFVCFHVAGLVFRDQRSLGKLETFLLAVLVYLSAISIFSLLGAKELIVPRFITDEGLGIHADRARGPFLQAVANGVCLNLLALVALDSFLRRKFRGLLAGALFVAVPVALLATKTRAVWVSAAFSVIFLWLFGSEPKLRRVALALLLAAAVGGSALFIFRNDTGSLADRVSDRSPVDFRTEMYHAGWQMFMEKPLLGWGNEWSVQPEVEKRVSGFQPEYYVFHNTFLELAVEHGLLGVGLYLWLMVSLFRLGKSTGNKSESNAAFRGRNFRRLWPVLLGVYLLNASAVVMNYQFVNALLFTFAGILAAQSGNFQHELTAQREWALA